MSVQRKKTAEGGRKGSRVKRSMGGVQIGHNARLFVFSLIFIKLNIKEQQGRQIVWVREFNLCSSRIVKRASSNEAAHAHKKCTKGYTEKYTHNNLKVVHFWKQQIERDAKYSLQKPPTVWPEMLRTQTHTKQPILRFYGTRPQSWDDHIEIIELATE